MCCWGPDGSRPGEGAAFQKLKGWVTRPGRTAWRGQWMELCSWLVEGQAFEADNGTCVSNAAGKEERMCRDRDI